MHPPPRGTPASPAACRPNPALRRRGTTTQLVVDGLPFLIFGGEIENSTASSVESLDAIWAGLVSLHLNTVLLPVYWELVEPEEGRFDFTLLDAALAGARANGRSGGGRAPAPSSSRSDRVNTSSPGAVSS